MLEISLLSLFLAGLLGGVHCLGMCGGIVTAVTVGSRSERQFPLLLAYNVGRIGSYVCIGALMGGLAQWGLTQAAYQPLQTGLFIAANVLLILLGLYLAGFSGMITRIEHLGRPLWRRIQPLARRFLPIRSVPQALAAGALWGWLPCGLVYTASIAALASGSAGSGAMVMLAFGLGTLPNLLLMGVFANRLAKLKQQRPIRIAAGLAVMLLGSWHLWLVVTSTG